MRQNISTKTQTVSTSALAIFHADPLLHCRETDNRTNKMTN